MNTTIIIALSGLGGSIVTAVFNWLISRNKRYTDILQLALGRVESLEKRTDAQDQEIETNRNLIHETVAERDLLKLTVSNLMLELKNTNDLLMSVRNELQEAMAKLRHAEATMAIYNSNQVINSAEGKATDLVDLAKQAASNLVEIAADTATKLTEIKLT